MEPKWNEEITRFIKDIHDLKNSEGSVNNHILEVLYNWVQEYFMNNNFENSDTLFYQVQNGQLVLKFLYERMIIKVDNFYESISIKTITNKREEEISLVFSSESFMNEAGDILISKTFFGILDDFTKNVYARYKENIAFIRM